MEITIMTLVLILTLAAPFAVLYAVSLVKKGNYEGHKKVQIITFVVCVLGVLLLEGLIRVSGGSGSLAGKSPYAGSAVFKTILYAHIAGAVLTYILWIIQMIFSIRTFKKTLPGNFSGKHKTMGKILVFGLFYTAITALIVYLMTLGLV